MAASGRNIRPEHNTCVGKEEGGTWEGGHPARVGLVLTCVLGCPGQTGLL